MKKYLKMHLQVFFVVIIIFILSTQAFAIPITSDVIKLNNQFNDGRYNGFDYVSFSPVSGEEDGIRYPLFIWLHGKGSGAFVQAQLGWYVFFNWTSDEYPTYVINATVA